MLSWKRALAAAVILAFAASGSLAQALTPLEQLGKHLFFDTNLSTPPGQACAACHAPDVGFTGPNASANAGGAVYEGAVTGRFGNRKPPASAYAGDSPILYYDAKGETWDGRATGRTLGDPLAEQAQGPFLNPLEQNNPSAADVVTKVSQSDYAALFIQVWGPGSLDPVNDPAGSYERIARSIAAYERSAEVNPFTSKYDYYLKGLVKLTKQEKQGLKLFQGQGKCIKCHLLQGPKPLLTDFTYDNLGLPKNPANPFYTMPPQYNPDGANWVDPGLGGFLAAAGYADQAQENWGKHKVPTLRNVDLRPSVGFVKAYGHNGYFKSLEDIVHFYNTRDVETWPASEVPQNVNTEELGNLGLTPAEEAAIVAFLKTLSDGYVLPAGKTEPAEIALGKPGLQLAGPNPFNPSTRFSYSLAQSGQVVITVYDVAGRQVATLVDAWRPQGQYTVDWSANLLPSGQYVVCMRADGRTSLRRVTLLK
jgi:cytochrome c peroxidase